MGRLGVGWLADAIHGPGSRCRPSGRPTTSRRRGVVGSCSEASQSFTSGTVIHRAQVAEPTRAGGGWGGAPRSIRCRRGPSPPSGCVERRVLGRCAAGYGRRTTAPHAPREQRAPPRPPAVYVIWRAMEPLTVPPCSGTPQRLLMRCVAVAVAVAGTSIRDSSPLWTGRWKWAEPRWTGCPRRPRWEAVGIIVGCNTCLG